MIGAKFDCCQRSSWEGINGINSPADRGTKKHVYLPYRGTISFWFYLVPLRLVSIFLNVGYVEISCGPLPTRFSTILL